MGSVAVGVVGDDAVHDLDAAGLVVYDDFGFGCRVLPCAPVFGDFVGFDIESSAIAPPRRYCLVRLFRRCVWLLFCIPGLFLGVGNDQRLKQAVRCDKSHPTFSILSIHVRFYVR